jgi:tetratricopeptide (TPR) repeat protein
VSCSNKKYDADMQKKFEDAFYTNYDKDEAIKILEIWEKRDNTNPEMYIDYFNYYLKLGSNSGIVIDAEKIKGAVGLEISDPKTNEIVGYIHDSTSYDPIQIGKALHYLNAGLKYGENRLDMYFGKIHVLNDIHDYKNASNELVKVLILSKRNGNKWLWSKNEPLKDDGELFLLNNLNDYYSVWIDAANEESIYAIRETSKKQIELYPKNVYAYNFLAYSYILKKDIKSALPILIEAEKIDAKDIVIINNIAKIYENLNDNKNAIVYWEKMAEYGDDEQKKVAETRIHDLIQNRN